MEITTQPAERNEARKPVKLHIERLVLHGFAPNDRRQIAAAVESELASLMNGKGALILSKNPSATERIVGQRFEATAETNAKTLGARIGRSVYQSLLLNLQAAGRGAVAERGTRTGGGKS